MYIPSQTFREFYTFCYNGQQIHLRACKHEHLKISRNFHAMSFNTYEINLPTESTEKTRNNIQDIQINLDLIINEYTKR